MQITNGRTWCRTLRVSQTIIRTEENHHDLKKKDGMQALQELQERKPTSRVRIQVSKLMTSLKQQFHMALLYHSEHGRLHPWTWPRMNVFPWSQICPKPTSIFRVIVKAHCTPYHVTFTYYSMRREHILFLILTLLHLSSKQLKPSLRTFFLKLF